MIYNLKTNNYKTFEIYKENVLEPRSYFIPFDNKDDMLATDIRTERYNSSMVAVLSGEWKFKYYSNYHQIPDSLIPTMKKWTIFPFRLYGSSQATKSLIM